MRLQDTYQLDSEAFSRGKLPGDREGPVIISGQHEDIKKGILACTLTKKNNVKQANIRDSQNAKMQTLTLKKHPEPSLAKKKPKTEYHCCAVMCI